MNIQERDTCEEGDYFNNEDFDRDLGTPSSRVASAMGGWFPKTTFAFRPPLEFTRREPTFTGRLGNQPRVLRSPSVESLETQLSLLTCSLKDGPVKYKRSVKARRRRSRKQTATNEQTESQPRAESPWIVFANKKKGFLDKIMVTQNAQMNSIYNIDQSNMYQVSGVASAYDLMEEDERQMVYQSAFDYGIRQPHGPVKKSRSVADISERDLQMKRQMLRKGGLAMQQKAETGKPKSSSGTNLQVQPELRRAQSAKERTEENKKINETKRMKKCVRVWETDLIEAVPNQEFSEQIRTRVKTATTALKRITGVGDPNVQISTRKRNAQFKRFVTDDFCRIPKMQQRVRISPQLSAVIGEDIQKRMGRPRYHAIKSKDVEAWAKHQKLDKSHRNLKVFNWLHSLNEEEFAMDLEPVIDDNPPGENLVLPLGAFHIEACDDPDEKPLLKKAAENFVHRVQQRVLSAQN